MKKMFRSLFFVIFFLYSSLVKAQLDPTFYVAEVASNLSKEQALNLAASVEEKTHIGSYLNFLDLKYEIRPFPQTRGIAIQVVRDMGISDKQKNYQVIASVGDDKANAAFLIEQKLALEFPQTKVKSARLTLKPKQSWISDYVSEFHVVILGAYKTQALAEKSLTLLANFFQAKSYPYGWNYHRHDDCAEFCLSIHNSTHFAGVAKDLWLITGPVSEDVDRVFREKLEKIKERIPDAYLLKSFLYYETF